MTDNSTKITDTQSLRDRPVLPALKRGVAQRCPACGKASLFCAFLKVHEACPGCGEALHHQRADDAPAYFTIAIVAHVVVGGLLAIEQAYAPPTWVQLALWLPATVILSILLLPRIKGALIALQWALRMHGFGLEKPFDPGLGEFVHPEMKDAGRSR